MNVLLQRMKCMPGGTTPWANVGKATPQHRLPNPRRCSVWRGCRSSKSLPALPTALLGPQIQLTGKKNTQMCSFADVHVCLFCHPLVLLVLMFMYFKVRDFFSRQLVAWHRPFCVDLEESTFTYLRNFLESYCDGIGNDTPPAPFLSKRYKNQ